MMTVAKGEESGRGEGELISFDASNLRINEGATLHIEICWVSLGDDRGKRLVGPGPGPGRGRVRVSCKLHLHSSPATVCPCLA